MLRSLKLFGCLLLLCAGSQPLFAYSLLGPIPAPGTGADGYQDGVIGYAENFTFGGEAFNGIDIGTPKNIGEGFRWNTPVVYYTFDAKFYGYFGSNGVTAVEQAIGILNAVPPLSTLSADLSEYPLRAKRMNYLAATLGLLDLKSETLALLVEELGLAQPERYVWTLRNRYVEPGLACRRY